MKKQRKKVVAKKKTPSNGKPKRVKCGMEGCRKYRLPDSDYCLAHAKEEALDPLEAVTKLTEIECLRFVAMDTEMRNHLQGIKIEDLELGREQVAHEAKRKQRLHVREQYAVALKAKQVQYKALVTEMAARFNMDPTKCAIDPDSGVIRDLRGEGTS